MLTNLSVRQVEQALQWLASPIQEPPPEELVSLSQLDWMLLDRMLRDLHLEQLMHPVH
jgi:hypothetical protein